MPLEDTNIFEIGATWPEQIERKGCGISFFAEMVENLQQSERTALRCIAPEQPSKQETDGGGLVPNNIVLHLNSTLKYVAENIVGEKIDNDQDHGS